MIALRLLLAYLIDAIRGRLTDDRDPWGWG